MAKIEIDGAIYQTTSRKGFPAIRKLNKNGNTARWIGLRSKTGLRVMRALEVEPAFAPGFSNRPTQPEKG